MLSDIITINGLIGADVNGRHICVKDTADNRSALFSIMADEKLANLIAEIVTNANGDADSNNPEEPPTRSEWTAWFRSSDTRQSHPSREAVAENCGSATRSAPCRTERRWVTAPCSCSRTAD